MALCDQHMEIFSLALLKYTHDLLISICHKGQENVFKHIAITTSAVVNFIELID